MANARIGALRVDLGANTAAFEKGLTKAERRMNSFKKRVGKIGDRLKGIGRIAAAGGAAIAGVGTAFAVAANKISTESREMANAARVAGEGFEEFQRQAFAAREVGIEFEKLSDIFKDTRERIGEFVVNGGGPLQDAFDAVSGKVRLTVDELRGLSGKDALQLIVARMEEAKLSTEEMSFVLESLGSDATALLPLLRDNAKAFDELGSRAAIISEEDQRGLDRYRESQLAFNNALKELTVTLVNRFLPQFTRAMDLTTEFIETLAKNARQLDETATRLGNFIEGVKVFADWVSRAWTATKNFLEGIGLASQRLEVLFDRANQALNPLASLVNLFERVGAASGAAGSTAQSVSLSFDQILAGEGNDEALNRRLDLTATAFGGFSTAAASAGKASKALTKNVGDLNEQLDKGIIKWSQYIKIRAANDNREAARNRPIEIDILPETAKLVDVVEDMQVGVETQTLKVQSNFAEMADGVTNTLRNLSSSIQGGGFLDILSGLVGAFTQLGQTGLFGSAIQSNLAGARAMGGPVTGGKSYLVGERGPELFTPSRSGSIVANHHLGGGKLQVEVVANNDGFGAMVRDQAGRVVASAAPSIANAGSALAQGQLRQQAGRRYR
ncbi:MAG: hypothetical protein AAGB23_05215 [Pseudomonadota bacterium]